MGPYYQVTSQGMGGLVESFYQHPILIVFLFGAAAGAGYFFWKKSKSDKQTDL